MTKEIVQKIIKRDGRIVDFDSSKIKNAINKAIAAVGEKNGKKAELLSDEVVSIIEKRFYGKIPTVEDVQDIVEEMLIREGYTKAAKAYILYREKRTEIREAKRFIGVLDDLKLSVNATAVLQRRYLLKDEDGRITETPKQMFKRVASAIAEIDLLYEENDVKKTEEEFYQAMSNLEFLPNSPTLMNAGTPINQLSACFVLPVEDSMEGIFDALKHMAMIHKSGGGVGFSFSKLRPKGDVVKSTAGIASGPVSFMQVFDVATDVIKQGGRRRGANMGVLSVYHPDILEFITAKGREGALTNFNLSVAVDDKFMQAVEDDRKYDLINPRNGKLVKKLRARDVFDLIVAAAWNSGDPGIVFLDEVNRGNPTPYVGRIEATNPCVASDTWIMTANGPRQVKELVGKRFTAILNGEEWKTSDNGFFLTGNKVIHKLKTKEGFELRLTEDHKILKVKRMTRYKMETKWESVKNLKSEDKVVLNNHRNYNGWNGEFNEKEGYLIGLLIGDGTIKKDKVVLSSWGDAVAVRTLVLNYAKELPHRSDFKGWMEIKGRGEYRLSLGYLKKLAKKLGLGPGKKTVTPEMEKASSKFCKGLLKGLFDADGSVQGDHLKGVSIRLAQSDIEILTAVQRILLRFGIFSKIYKNRRSRSTSKLPNGKGGTKEYHIKPQHELVISNESMYHFHRMIGFGDSKKAEKLKKAIKSYKRKMNKEHFIATIEEVVPDTTDKVYDVQIPGINAFDANGFYIHNCGEQPLLPYESCNLGSINLVKMVKNSKIDWDKLKNTVKTAVHFLDNVIDANNFPIPQIEVETKKNRKIGLGVMGFAEMLIMLGIPYDSHKALKIAEEIMSFIKKHARDASVELGKSRGSFSNFKGSVWDKEGYEAMRNATTTTIAPTGTISIIADVTSGIEPLFAVSFVRDVMEGTKLLEVNALFEEIAKKRGFYSRELMMEIARKGSVQDIDRIPEDVRRIFVTALDIEPKWHVKMQAAFQKHVDNAVAKTVNLPSDASLDDVREVFMLAYKLKCKGITVYRYGSKKRQVLYLGSLFEGEPIVEHVSADSEYSGGCPATVCTF